MKGFTLLFACFCITLSGVSQRVESNKNHHEDLSVIRPRFNAPVDSAKGSAFRKDAPLVTPVLTVNEKVNAVLDSIDRLNVLRKFVPGFTIQIYSGQNREEANNSKRKLLDELGMKADLQYQQPKFRVKVGGYFTMLDAQRELMRIKRYFPNAILVPESIPIK